MSMAMSVLTARPLPTLADIQQALIELGFDLALATDTAFYSGGFRQMTIGAGHNMQSGVEIDVCDAATFAKEQSLRPEARFGQLITCRWSASLDEGHCGLAVCAAIAKVTDGAIFSYYTGSFISLEDVVAEAKGLLEEARTESPPSLRQEWPLAFLAIVQRQWPAYRLNPRVRWPGTEFVRESGAVFHSLSSGFRSGQFAHYFAVTASLSPAGLAPFHVGSRWGLGELAGLPPTHKRRKGYEDIVRGFCAEAESERASSARATLKRAAPLLLRCLDSAASKPDLLRDEARSRHYGRKLGPYPFAAVIADPPREWRSLPSQELPEAIVCVTREGLIECREEWSEISSRLEALLRQNL